MLNFFELSHILFIARSRHRPENFGLWIHELHVDLKSWWKSRSKARKVGLNVLGLCFGIWIRPMESNEFVSNDKRNKHLALPDFHYSLISGCWLGNRFQTFGFSKSECDRVVTGVEGSYILGISRGSYCNERRRKNEENNIVLEKLQEKCANEEVERKMVNMKKWYL